MESFRPNPVSESAVHPAIPIMVMNILRLYRNRFRPDTFPKNDRRFQTNPIFSSSTLFPALGALGRISSAGVSRSAFLAVRNTVSPIAATMLPADMMIFAGLNSK